MLDLIVTNRILQRSLACAWREHQDRNQFPWTQLASAENIVIWARPIGKYTGRKKWITVS